MPEKRSGYTPVYATGIKSDEFRNFHRVLIDDEDKFDRMIQLWDQSDKTVLAFDTETNSCLDPDVAKLVGCSLAFNHEYGFYLPFYHAVGTVLDLKYFARLERLLHEAQTVLYYNTRFDLRIQRKYGHDISKIKDFDVSIAVWNWDTNVKMPALKKIAAKYILGWDLETYEQKFGKTQDLSMYFPEEVVDYAVYDSVALLHLYDRCAPIREEAGYTISLDNSLTRTIMRIEDRPHPINRQLLEETSEEVERNIRRLEQEIYHDIGYDFKITSHEQLARELQRLGLDTGEYTEQKKTMKTGLKYLKRLEGKHPVVGKIMEFKKLNKLHNSFISSLLESYREDLGGCRFSYHLNDAPTGRLASGNDKRNTYFGNLNIQAITKSGSLEYLAIPAVSGDSRAILGYSFCPLIKTKDVLGETVYTTKSGRQVGRDIFGILVEGQQQENNVRSAFEAHPGHWFVHFDYKAQELRIPANVAHDSYLTETFNSGKDPHKEVAILMFGAENYDKDKRKIAKILNFCETNSNFVRTSTGWKRPANLLPEDLIRDRFGREMPYRMEVVKDQPCVEIELSNGVVARYHEQHKLLVWDAGQNQPIWKEVRDLTSDDEIISIIESGQKTCNSKEPLAYLAGLYLGDGNRNHRGHQITVCLDKRYSDQQLQLLPPEHTSYPSSSSQCSIHVFYGLDRDIWTTRKAIPDEVFSSWSVDQRKWLLAGLIDSDGTAWNNETSIAFQNTNRELIHQVALLCNSLGLRTHISSIQPGVTDKGVRRYVNKKGEPYARLYTLYITRTSDIDLPIQLPHKQRAYSHTGRRNSNFSFSVGPTLVESIYPEMVRRLSYKDRKVQTLDNIRRGRCGLSWVAVQRLGPDSPYPIREDYSPVKVLKTTACIDTIYAIEVESHEYLSQTCVSHNSMLYGASKYTIAERLGCSVDEAMEYMMKWWKIQGGLRRWRDKTEKQGEVYGFVKTAFGRIRRVGYWFQKKNENGGQDFRALGFAKRTCVNTVIQGCLQSHVRILTDHGYIPVRELYETDTSGWRVHTGTNWATFEVLNRGPARLAQIRTHDGKRLDCDTRHEVRTHTMRKHSKFTPVSELSKFRRICSPHPQALEFGSEMGGYSEEIAEQIFYWLGYYMGDGWLGLEKGYMEYIFGRHEEERARLCRDFFQSLGMNTRIHFKVNDIGGKSIIVETHSKKVTRLFRDILGLKPAIARTKRIPEIVWRSSLHLRQAFIRGFQESDGCLRYKNLHLMNNEVLRELQLLMEVSVSTKTRLSGPFSCGSSTLLWDVKSTGCSRLDSEYSFSSFQSLTILDTEDDTYTLSVHDDKHQFVSEGIISKNTAGDMMRAVLLVLDNVSEYPESDFQILSTVHDEINFSIKKEILPQAVGFIQNIMQRKLLPDWEVDMEVDMEVGTSWGWMFPFRYDNGLFVPQGEIVTQTNPSVELEIEEIFEEDEDENGEEF